MTQLDTQLKSTLEQFREMEKVNKHLDQLNKRLSGEYKNLEKLTKILDKEQADVEKLEKMSLKGIFYKVLGSKEAQLEKERQEYLQASLKYNELVKSVDLLEFERKVLEEKSSKFVGIEDRLKNLMKKRERQLMNSNSVLGRKLLNVLKQIEGIQKTGYEIDQAMDAGAKCLGILAEISGYLRNARNWGNWDMAGRRRGHMTSYIKHSNIDKARRRISQAQNLLWRFQEELNDVYDTTNLDLRINMDSFNSFIDIFFDNLISDWIIQKRIRNSHNNIVSVHDKVTRIVQNLKMRQKQDQDRAEALEDERSKLLLEI